MKSRNKKALKIGPRQWQKNLQALLISLIALGFFWASQQLTTAELPSSQDPPLLYSTQLRDDLTLTLQSSISQAKESVLLIIYTLTDSKIIKALKKKSEEGIPVTVVTDGRASPFLERKLGPTVKVVKRFGDGIMHQKILVVDRSMVWIGSANMTGESLNMHGNLITGLLNPALGEMVMQKAKTLPEEGKGVPFVAREFLIGGQKLEMWFLPDNPSAVQKIKSLIDGAQKSIRIAMFTWSRMDFAEHVAKARQRGVKVTVALDRYAGKGAGAKVAAFLKDKGVPVFFYQGPGLLHHKFMEIDDERLVNGSANWTKAAFEKNDDCFIVLHNLTTKQQGQMNKLWEFILADSSN